MILAVDPGIASCGWAIVQPRPCRVVDLGVWTSKPDKALDKSTDRARRVHMLGLELARLVGEHHCTVIAAEGALCHGTINAVVPQAMVWGALAMLAVHGLELVEVLAKQWQHAITGDVDKVSYPDIERALTCYVGDRVERIHPRLRTHALDAVGVGLFTSLRPTTRVA